MFSEPIFNYKTKIYIAKRLEPIQDNDMNEIEVFDTPKKYFFNIQPVSADSETREFGQLANSMRVATIPKRLYMGKFNEYDRVYIDTTPENETENGENADYRVYSIRPQNACIIIYFKKLVSNSMMGDE